MQSYLRWLQRLNSFIANSYFGILRIPTKPPEFDIAIGNPDPSEP